MLTASSATVFRLEPGLKVLSISACVALAGMGVLMGVMGVDYGTPWVVAAAGAIVLGSAWLLVRAARVRVSFDADTLVILGFFRTHRIARTAVLEVDHYSLDRPTVRWAPPGESDRWAVLSPLALSSNALVTRSMRLRRRRFLAQLRRWAPDDDRRDVSPGLESRMNEALGRGVLAVRESPVLRTVMAVVLVGVAGAAYWLSWTTLTAVIGGTVEFGRGTLLPPAVAGLALEGAYWLLPLSRRRPRVWHVLLGIVLTPLVVMLVMALTA